MTHWDCGHYYTSEGRQLSSLQTNRHPNINAILNQYEVQLSESRQLDFELILRYAHELIAANPSISALLGSIFSSILVDEYQDTKEIQYAIIASILKAGHGKGQKSKPSSLATPIKQSSDRLGVMPSRQSN